MEKNSVEVKTSDEVMSIYKHAEKMRRRATNKWQRMARKASRHAN